jgi:quercetin dioxygenase-like cupin family protein
MAQNWDGLPEHEVFPGFRGRFIHTERMSFVRWRIAAGAVLPAHSHPHEQVAHVYAGEFEIVVEGVARRLVAGDVAAIPPDAVHSGRAITDCDIVDAFAPVRDDYRKYG